MTPARRALMSVLQVTTGREVAARCRVSPSTVSQWAAGLACPSKRSRAVLAATYKIPEAGWTDPRPRYRFSARG